MVTRWEKEEVEVVRIRSLRSGGGKRTERGGCLTPVLLISVALLQLGWVTPPRLGVWPNLILV